MAGTSKIRGNLYVAGNLTVTGTLSPASTEFADNAFTVKDNGDATKKGAFQLSGVTAGQTRTLTFPDYDGTIATLAGTESLTNKSLTSPKVVTGINDTNGKELVKVTATASAVNEFTVANAATTGAPALTATGDDANISIKIGAKGTGQIIPTVGNVLELVTVTTKAEASDQTYTAAQMLGGLIVRDPNGGARNDTTPTAALMVAAIPGAIVGTSFCFDLKNSADANETITVAAGAGCSIVGTATVAQSNTKRFRVVLTNIGAGTEAYTLYSLGTLTH